MTPRHRISKRHQFRLVLCGHKAFEAGAVCLVLMVQGHLGDVTLAHFLIATKTGLLAVSPAVGATFTRYARHFANKWASSIFLGVCTFVADAVIHGSHYPGAYTEAALTGVGAFAFSMMIAATSIGRRIDTLAETVFHPQRVSGAASADARLGGELDEGVGRDNEKQRDVHGPADKRAVLETSGR